MAKQPKPGGGYQPDPSGPKPTEGPKSGSVVTSKGLGDRVRRDGAVRLGADPMMGDKSKLILLEHTTRLEGELAKARREAQRTKYALIASQNERLAAATEHDQTTVDLKANYTAVRLSLQQAKEEHVQILEATRKELWNAFEKTETKLEAEIKKLTRERDDARQRADLLTKTADELLTKTADELREQRAAYEKQIDHLNGSLHEKVELVARIYHALEVLKGDFTPPEIDEIRRVRGLEPLSTGGGS